METKLTTKQLNNRTQYWTYNQGLVVFSEGLSGGLALLWKPETKVHVINFSCWFIDAHVVCPNTGHLGDSPASMDTPTLAKGRKLGLCLNPLANQTTSHGFVLETTMK